MNTSLVRENEAPGLSRGLSKNDFVVVIDTGNARDFIRILTVELQ
jgi:hypothetical protein